MGIKADRWIAKMAKEQRMIEPFVENQVREGVVSYGLSSYGYDIRVADEYKIFTNVYSAVVDPKNFDKRSMVDFQGEVCVIPPNSFALARTVEYFRIPRSILTICVGKSTYARCGIIVNVTPFEPEWEGFVPWKSPIPPRCRLKSTPTRGLPRCCSLTGMKFATSLMRTARENIRINKPSFCQGCR